MKGKLLLAWPGAAQSVNSAAFGLQVLLNGGWDVFRPNVISLWVGRDRVAFSVDDAAPATSSRHWRFTFQMKCAIWISPNQFHHEWMNDSLFAMVDWLSMVLRLHQHNIGYTAENNTRKKSMSRNNSPDGTVRLNTALNTAPMKINWIKSANCNYNQLQTPTSNR